MPVSRISVVIPTYNGSKSIKRCLQSLKGSGEKPFEILVVDDASSDGVGEIAEEFGCRVVRLENNVGAARARNIGAKQAAGEILFFLDDDVEIAAEAISVLMKNYADVSVDGVVGIFDTAVPFTDFASNLKNLWMRFTYVNLSKDKIGLFFTSAASMRRSTFLELGGFDENYRGASIAEDTDFGQRAWAAGRRIVLEDGIVVKHHKHYTLAELLKTDFQRARALTLMRLRKWNQKFFTSVPVTTQFSIPILFLALCFFGLSVLNGAPLWLAASGLVIFYFLNARWLLYVLKERGFRFALAAFLFQPLNSAIVGGGMAAACFRFIAGQRY